MMFCVPTPMVHEVGKTRQKRPWRRTNPEWQSIVVLLSRLCVVFFMVGVAHRAQAGMEITPLLEGDVNIVAILGMHPEPARKLEHCRSLLASEGIQLASALFYAAEKINSNPELLPQVRLGVTIVDGVCENSPSTLRDVIRYISGPKSKGLQWSFLPVISGLKQQDPTYRTIHYALEALDIPLLFLESSGGDLDGDTGMSLLPPRRSMAHAVFDVVRAYEMRELLVVTQGENDAWRGLVDELESDMRSYIGMAGSPEHMCLRQVVRLPEKAAQAAGEVRRLVTSLADPSRSQAIIVVLADTQDIINDIMREAQAQNVTNRAWIVPNMPEDLLGGTGSGGELIENQDVIVLRDTNRAAARDDADFLSFLTAAAQRSLSQSQNDWIGLYVRQRRHWCIWTQNFTAQEMQLCQRIVSNPPEFAPQPLARQVIDAVRLIAAAVDGLSRLYCSIAGGRAPASAPASALQPLQAPVRGPASTPAVGPPPAAKAAATAAAMTCPMASFKPKAALFREALRNATARATDNSTMTYQEAFASFKLPRYSISRKRASSASLQHVTDWKIRSIVENTIRRSISQADVDEFAALCEPDCAPGTRRETPSADGNTGTGRCAAHCSTCTTCQPGLYSAEENSDECRQCPDSWIANAQGTACQELELDVLRWTDPRAIAVLAIASIALLILVALLLVLLRWQYQGHARDIGLVLLISVCMAVALTTPLHVLLPTVGSCSLRFILRHVVFGAFGLCVCLFVLSRSLVNSDEEGSSDGGGSDDWSKSLLYLASLTTAVLIAALICLVASPATARITVETERVTALTCRHSTATMSVMVAMGCVVALATLFMSLSAWRSGESVLLPVSAIIFFAVWLALNLVRHYSRGASNQLYDVALNLVLLAVSLLGLALPAAAQLHQKQNDESRRINTAYPHGGGHAANSSTSSHTLHPTKPTPQRRTQQASSASALQPQSNTTTVAAGSTRGRLSRGMHGMWPRVGPNSMAAAPSAHSMTLSKYENNAQVPPQPGYMLCGYPNTHSDSKSADYEFFHGVAGRHVKFSLDQEVQSYHDTLDDGHQPERPQSPPEFAFSGPMYAEPPAAPQPTPRQLAPPRKAKPPPPSDPPPEY